MAAVLVGVVLGDIWLLLGMGTGPPGASWTRSPGRASRRQQTPRHLLRRDAPAPWPARCPGQVGTACPVTAPRVLGTMAPMPEVPDGRVTSVRRAAEPDVVARSSTLAVAAGALTVALTAGSIVLGLADDVRAGRRRSGRCRLRRHRRGRRRPAVRGSSSAGCCSSWGSPLTLASFCLDWARHSLVVDPGSLPAGEAGAVARDVGVGRGLLRPRRAAPAPAARRRARRPARGGSSGGPPWRSARSRSPAGRSPRTTGSTAHPSTGSTRHVTSPTGTAARPGPARRLAAAARACAPSRAWSRSCSACARSRRRGAPAGASGSCAGAVLSVVLLCARPGRRPRGRLRRAARRRRAAAAARHRRRRACATGCGTSTSSSTARWCTRVLTALVVAVYVVRRPRPRGPARRAHRRTARRHGARRARRRAGASTGAAARRPRGPWRPRRPLPGAGATGAAARGGVASRSGPRRCAAPRMPCGTPSSCPGSSSTSRTVRSSASGTPTADGIRVPLVHSGAVVGHLEVGPRRVGRPLSAGDLRLLDDLARHVAVAAHAVQLREALQTSRERHRHRARGGAAPAAPRPARRPRPGARRGGAAGRGGAQLGRRTTRSPRSRPGRSRC